MTGTKNPLDNLFPGLEEDGDAEVNRSFDGKTIEDDPDKEAVAASLEAVSADLERWLNARDSER